MTAPAETITVPSYKLGSRLGAEVFAAHHIVLKREVVIRVLAADYSPDAVARFVADARAVGKLSHTNIAELVEIGELQDGRWYIVTERLRGQTLGEILRERARLPLAEAVPILRGVAAAVDAAHAAGIAHRDLEPDHVFVLGDGRVKVIDFGLALLTRKPDAPATAYMSPEQCRGEDAGAATDTYSFGALAFHVLAGEPPFTDEMSELARQHIEDTPPLPSAFVAELSRRVDRAVLALLAKAPSDRPRSLASTVSLLARESVPRRKLAPWLLAGAGAAILVGAGVLIVNARDGDSHDSEELPDGCEPAATLLLGAWDPGRRATLAGQYAASPRPDVAATWLFMSTSLDTLFARWSERWDVACRPDEHRRDPRLAAQRVACLHRYFDVLRGHVDTMADTAPEAFSSSLLVANDLFPPDDCANSEPGQLTPALRAEEDRLVRDLYRDETYIASETGNTELLDAILARAAANARALEQLRSPMAATAWNRHAAALLNASRDVAEVKTALDAAARVATKHRFDVQLALAEAGRAFVATYGGKVADARAAVERAEAAYERAGRPASSIEVVVARARLEGRLGHVDRAVELFREVIAKLDGGTTRLSSVWARRDLIQVLIPNGRVAEAVAVARESVAIAQSLLGDHAITLAARASLVDALVANGQLHAAAVEGERLANWLQLGELALRLGDGARFAGAMARAADTSLPEPERWADIGYRAWQVGAIDLAVEALDRVDRRTAAPATVIAVDDLRAYHAFKQGDFASMAASAERVTEDPTNDGFRHSPWLRALAEARAGQRAEAERRLDSLKRFRDLKPLLAATTYAYSAFVLAELGRGRDAVASSRRGIGILDDIGYRGTDRGEATAFLGAMLVELGDLEAARQPLEDAVHDSVHYHHFDYFTPMAQFALARALWPVEADRARARRLAELARDGYARLGRFRAPYKDAVVAWLADPGKPVTQRMFP